MARQLLLFLFAYCVAVNGLATNARQSHKVRSGIVRRQIPQEMDEPTMMTTEGPLLEAIGESVNTAFPTAAVPAMVNFDHKPEGPAIRLELNVSSRLCGEDSLLKDEDNITVVFRLSGINATYPLVRRGSAFFFVKNGEKRTKICEPLLGIDVVWAPTPCWCFNSKTGVRRLILNYPVGEDLDGASVGIAWTGKNGQEIASWVELPPVVDSCRSEVSGAVTPGVFSKPQITLLSNLNTEICGSSVLLANQDNITVTYIVQKPGQFDSDRHSLYFHVMDNGMKKNICQPDMNKCVVYNTSTCYCAGSHDGYRRFTFHGSLREKFSHAQFGITWISQGQGSEVDHSLLLPKIWGTCNPGVAKPEIKLAKNTSTSICGGDLLIKNKDNITAVYMLGGTRSSFSGNYVVFFHKMVNGRKEQLCRPDLSNCTIQSSLPCWCAQRAVGLHNSEELRRYMYRNFVTDIWPIGITWVNVVKGIELEHTFQPPKVVASCNTKPRLVALKVSGGSVMRPQAKVWICIAAILASLNP